MRRRPVWLLPVLLVAVLAAGAYLATRSAPADYGWFAYAPDGSVDAPLVVTDRQVAGWALLAAGLIAASAWGGYQLGRRVSSDRA